MLTPLEVGSREPGLAVSVDMNNLFLKVSEDV